MKIPYQKKGYEKSLPKKRLRKILTKKKLTKNFHKKGVCHKKAPPLFPPKFKKGGAFLSGIALIYRFRFSRFRNNDNGFAVHVQYM